MIGSSVAWQLIVGVVWLLGLSVHAVSPGEATSYEMCRTSHVTLGGAGSHGNITSIGYPDSVSDRSYNEPMCSMTLTACAGCRISVKVVDMSLPHCDQYPNMGSCIYGCDSLMIYDIGMPEATTRYFKHDSQGQLFKGNTSRIFIKYCHTIMNNGKYRRFLLQYMVYEKRIDINVDPGEGGYFHSFGFPNGFRSPTGSQLSGEIFYYHIHCYGGGTVRLWFDDWSLPRSATVTLYQGPSNASAVLADVNGSDKRPFVLSHVGDLFMKLYTGDAPDMYFPHVGLTAEYECAETASWFQKPLQDCGDNLHSLKGGVFGFNFSDSTCITSTYIDCLWVIWKYDYHFSRTEKLMMQIKSLAFQIAEDDFEIREGNNSLSPRIFHSDSIFGDRQNVRSLPYSTNGDAFYVRLKGRCSRDRHVEGVFATYEDRIMGSVECPPDMFGCLNNRCIARSLTCDGVDHCLDGFAYDEMYCSRLSTVGCSSFLRCDSDNMWYCKDKQCDKNRDCADGTDEKNCWIDTTPSTAPDPAPDIFSAYHWGTIIPIVLICIVLAVIACIIVSYYTRRKQRARQRRQAQGRTDNSIANPGVPGPMFRFPEAPPTYEESMTSPPDMGIFNMSYSRTDSMDHLGQPPPYTPVAEAPVPIQYQPPAYPLPQPSGGRSAQHGRANMPTAANGQIVACSPGVHTYSPNTGLLNHFGQMQHILNAQHGTSVVQSSPGVPSQSVSDHPRQDGSQGTAPDPQSRSGQTCDQEERSMSGQGALGNQILPVMGTNIEMREIANEHMSPTRNFHLNTSQDSRASSAVNVDSPENSNKDTHTTAASKPQTFQATDAVNDEPRPNAQSLPDKDHQGNQNKPSNRQRNDTYHQHPQGAGDSTVPPGGTGVNHLFLPPEGSEHSPARSVTLENSSASFV